jgi:serine protease AprX
VAAAAVGCFCTGASAQERFTERGLSPELAGRQGSVRVVVVVRGGLRLAHAARVRRQALLATPSVPRLSRLRSAGKLATLAYARRQERSRADAIHALTRVSRRAAARQRPAQRAVVRLGGRVVTGSTLDGSFVAVAPAQSLRRLAARPDVQSISLATVMKPLDDIASAAFASGAPTWWAAGHTGGRGGADVSASLSVVQDPVYRRHPAFGGLTFETVPGEPDQPASFGLTGHGTALLSMVAAQGATGCAPCVAGDARERGTAYGVSKVLDPVGAYSEFDWPLGVTYGHWDSDAHVWRYQPGASDPAQALNYSRGGEVAFDDDSEAQDWDMMVDAYGATAAIAAGNSGPSPRTVNNPALAYNVIGVGGYCCSGSPDHTTDAVWTWSSRGPTVAGRKKPDLVAPGDGDLADVLYNTTGSLWKYQTGTSFAAPQVAAAAILLAGAGIRDPKVVKAILIDSARQGRAAPDQPWGSQTGWQPDFGWGELDLDAAYRERLNFARGSVPAHGARFFRATAQQPGDRATLVWHRRVMDCVEPRQGCTHEARSGWHVYTLSNLDLAAYDAATGVREATSNSTIDNVEQIRTTHPGGVVYKVTAGGVDALASEPFALAATRSLTPLTTPQPAINLTTADRIGTNQDVAVTATVSNPSPDLVAPDTRVTLVFPDGVELVAGSATQMLGTLATNGSATATWTVRGTTDGLQHLTATATTAVYGTTLTGTKSTTLTVDGTAPQVTLAVPGGTTRSPAIPVTWSATDLAGVASYDVDVSLDGGPWSPWLAATTNTSATYAGTPGSTYRFRVRARDAFGNTSAYVTSAATTIALPTPPPARSRRAGLTLTTVKRRTRTLLATGSLDPAATGTVALTWTARRRTARTTVAVADGTFEAHLRIPRRARRRASTATLTLRYSGDAAFAPERIRRRLRTR